MLKFLIVLSLAVTTATTRKILWELENYNEWNLPFAKTVEIEGYSGGSYTHNLAPATYKMRVDPSSRFSILWLDEA